MERAKVRALCDRALMTSLEGIWHTAVTTAELGTLMLVSVRC